MDMVDEITMKNTKKEMLGIIDKMRKKIDEKEKTKLDPEKIKDATKTKETVKKADQITSSDLSTLIHNLKISINKELTTLSDKIEAEATKYQNLNQAIKLKQAELDEIYGIEKEAAKLVAIIEGQNHIKEQFDDEMAEKRESLEKELKEKRMNQEDELDANREKLETKLSETKANWEKEKKAYLESWKEEKNKIQSERVRENEEYEYTISTCSGGCGSAA